LRREGGGVERERRERRGDTKGGRQEEGDTRRVMESRAERGGERAKGTGDPRSARLKKKKAGRERIRDTRNLRRKCFDRRKSKRESGDNQERKWEGGVCKGVVRGNTAARKAYQPNHIVNVKRMGKGNTKPVKGRFKEIYRSGAEYCTVKTGREVLRTWWEAGSQQAKANRSRRF